MQRLLRAKVRVLMLNDYRSTVQCPVCEAAGLVARIPAGPPAPGEVRRPIGPEALGTMKALLEHRLIVREHFAGAHCAR